MVTSLTRVLCRAAVRLSRPPLVSGEACFFKNGKANLFSTRAVVLSEKKVERPAGIGDSSRAVNKKFAGKGESGERQLLHMRAVRKHYTLLTLSLMDLDV